MGHSFLKLVFLSSVLLLLATCAPASNIPDQPTVSASQTANLPLANSTIPVADSRIPAVSIAQIPIDSPGPQSRLTSPINLDAQLYSGADDKVRVELFTDDGQLLARKILKLENYTDLTSELQTSLDFEVDRSSDATLILSTEDQYGRVQALNSVDVTLLTEAEQVISVAPEFADAIRISSPTQGEEISDGRLTISGQASSRPGRALNIQLITREGRVLTFGEVYPHFETDSTWGTFEIKLSYEVKETTWVQIAITENNPQIPRPIHFSGIEVLLIP